MPISDIENDSVMLSGLQEYGTYFAIIGKRCDHGIYGFKRYIALAVLARNIQQIEVKLRQKELASLERKEKILKKAA